MKKTSTQCLLSVVVRDTLFTSRVVVVVIVVIVVIFGSLFTPPPSKTPPFEQILTNEPELLHVIPDLFL